MRPRGSGRFGRLVLAGLVVAGAVALGPDVSDAQSADWSIVRLAPLTGHGGSVVTDVNNEGVAVGYSQGGFTPLGLDTTAVIWSSDGTPTALPEPVSGAAKALAINDEGEIVGEVITAPVVGLGATTAVLWTPGEAGYAATALGNGSAHDINDDGVIVGATTAGRERVHQCRARSARATRRPRFRPRTASRSPSV